MKHFLVLISLSLLANTSFAESSNCEVRLVQNYEGASNEIMPKIEDILIEKGYRVINDGLLYESTHVVELKVRQELLTPGTLIGLDNTNFNILPTGQACENWSISKKNIINCSFRFSLSEVNQDKKIVKIADIEENLRVKANIFNSKKRIVKNFRKNILDRAAKEIPECK